MTEAENAALKYAAENPLPSWTQVGTVDQTIPAFLAGAAWAIEAAAKELDEASNRYDPPYGGIACSQMAARRFVS